MAAANGSSICQTGTPYTSGPDASSHNTDQDFRRQSFVLMACLLPTISVLGYLATQYNWVVAWILGIVTACVVLFTLLVLFGFYIWSRGQLPLKKDEEAKYIEVKPDHRIVEYYTWGSDKDDATPLVVLHGSGTTGKIFHQHLFQDQVLKDMNVKVISPSFPGHGGSDMHRYRRITDWPISDLVPILEREKVDKFLVIGSSYGTAHAMAVASAIPDRCLAVGLNAPYLPEAICREAGMWTDADMILREKQLEKPWILLPVLSCISLAQGFIPMGIKAYPEGKAAYKECPELMDALVQDAKRCFIRGVNGQVYEMTNAETTQTWPDPRKIVVKNIAVWYGEDDGIVPPDHGKWLVANLTSDGRNYNLHVRSDKRGLDHFSYMTPEHVKTGIMTKVLLEMVASEEKK